MPGHVHALAAERSRVQPAEHASAAAVGQYVQREHVLPNPSGGQQDALGLLLGPSRQLRCPRTTPRSAA
jgi:hypothetical protein